MPFPQGATRRWLEELRDLAHRHGAAWRLASVDPPSVEGDLDTNAGSRRYRVSWGPEYPLRPPSVWELAQDGNVVDHSATGHAFADRSICLYGHTPESGWKPEYTAAQAIEQLAMFLEATDRSLFPGGRRAA